MSNPEIVKQLRSAAEDALNRGFAIITCLPHDKAPYATYSPNACNSGTRKPEIALKAWDDGHEANYGISCGMSNVTVVDCDHGLQTYEEFIAWRDKNHFPVTLTARSGNTDGYRVHMFYSGAVKTRGFDIDGVTGELKGEGGYVVGAGSIHPSGELYQWIVDEDIQPLPEGLQELAKTKKVLPNIAAGEKIPAGNRWNFMQSVAGKLRNAGLSEEGIEAALWDFLKRNCEDGENYPPDKVSALAKASMEIFNAEQPTVIVFDEGGKVDTTIINLDDTAIDGDWLGDMTRELTNGTPVPPAFVRSVLKTIVSESLDRMVAFPHHSTLHTRHWSILIAPAQSGKGESWNRVSKWALPNYIKDSGIMMADSGWYSSGEHLVKKFIDNGFESQRVLTQFDEMRLLFEKGGLQNSTLISRLLELFESGGLSAGSLSHEGGTLTDVSLSMTGGFTPDQFRNALSGKGVAGDGFLSRCVISYCGDKDDQMLWKDPDTALIQALQKKFQDRWMEISNLSKTAKFMPEQSPESLEIYKEFHKFLRSEDRKDLIDAGSQYTTRLEDHFKRDLLMRTIFSDDPSVITADATMRAVEWAKHELYLRHELWPADASDQVAQLCVQITKCLRKKAPIGVTRLRLMDYCNVKRSGLYDQFDRAFKSLLRCGAIVVIGQSHKKTDMFVLYDSN
jgi:hypothetical protein